MAPSEHKIGVFVRFLPLKPSFSGISSTKSAFLCAFALQNPHFRAFRAQNRGFCALLPASFFPMLPQQLAPGHSVQGLPRSGNSSAQTSASLHGLPLLRHSKSFGPSAPIAYATCVSPPDEAAAWPGAGVRWQMRLPHRGERTEGNRTVGNALLGTHHPRTLRSGNALCGEYYSPALRRSAFSATGSWSITS